jgi:hypothetical protein
VWKRTVNGKTLNFHLAGINNQNFIMRDEQTGSYWQQVSGKAISGPMIGATLELASTDELAFGLWKAESPGGTVLQISGKDSAHYEKDWEEKLKKYPTVLSFSESKIPGRELIVGLSLNGSDRAYPVQRVIEQKVIHDRLSGVNVIIVAGPDNKSVRAFRANDLEFFRKEGDVWSLVDSVNAKTWDFRGCSDQECLEPMPLLKDFWFDWRQYHPKTTVYKR